MVTGENACASPENLDSEIGRKIAHDNAMNKIWMLDKLSPEARRAVQKYGAIQWLLAITQKYGKQ